MLFAVIFVSSGVLLSAVSALTCMLCSDGSLAEDCDSGQEQRAEAELYKLVLATGAEAMEAHGVKLSAMITKLQTTMADREAQKEVYIQCNQFIRAQK